MAALGDLLLPSHAGMDDDSYKLAMELMLEDSRQIASGADGKGKRQEGSYSDTQIAFRLYAQELESAATVDADRRLSASLQRAVQTDANAVLQFQYEERMAQHDHEVAVALSEGRAPPPMPPPPPAPAPVLEPVAEEEPENNERIDTPSKGKGKEPVAEDPKVSGFATTLKRQRDGTFDFRDETDDDIIFLGKRLKQGESSAWAASREPEENQRPCTSCLEVLPESQVIRAPCKHDYCHECIKGLFTSAMRDESLFPPKCCQQAIPAGEHAEVLGENLVNLYHAKRIEFSTENRTYCHRADCGNFIKPIDVGTCQRCNKQTCVSCKKAAHIGDCPQDTELTRVLELAEQENWRRCKQCNTMVELAHGCNHMTCRCGAQFCYICGIEWKDPKQCACPLFTEENLIEERERRQRRNNPPVANPHLVDMLARVGAGVVPRQPPPRQPLLDLEQEECDHDAPWRRRRFKDGHVEQCDICTASLSYYLYECTDCDLAVCRRCRFNRL